MPAQIPTPRVPAPAAAVKPAPPQAVARDTVVPPQEIVAALCKSADDSRLYRLRNLARNNKDVAWLLAQTEKKSKKKTEPAP